MLELPLHLSRRRVDRLQESAIRLGLFRRKIRAAIKCVTGFIRLRSRAENVALIACRHVEQFCLRIECGRKPIRRPQRAWTNCMPLKCRRSVLVRYRSPLLILRVTPGCFAVGIRGNKLTRGTIEHVKESIAVGLRDQMLSAGVTWR